MPSVQSRYPFWPLMLLFAAFSMLIGLGTWQLQRLAWKNDLIARIEARGKSAPVPLADVIAAAANGGDVAFKRVTLTGSFDHSGEIHLYSLRGGKAGWHVFTPFQEIETGEIETGEIETGEIETGNINAGQVVFVNRGFVTEALKEAALRQAGQIGGQQRLTGIVRLGETQTMFVPDNDAARNQWHWRDLAAMQAQLPGASRMVPFLVELEGTPPPGGWPIPAPISPKLPNRHLEYALTWFALAATLLAVFAVYVRGRLRPSSDAGETG